MNYEQSQPTAQEGSEAITHSLVEKETGIFGRFINERAKKLVRAFSLLTMLALAEHQGNTAHAAEKVEENTTATQFFNLEKGAQGSGRQFVVEEKNIPQHMKIDNPDAVSPVILRKKNVEEYKTSDGFTKDANGNMQRKSIGEIK